MSKNAVGREIPEEINGITIKPFEGAVKHTPLVRQDKGNRSLLPAE